MAGFENGRLQTAARAIGVMQAAYEDARQYAADRTVFGKPVADYQLTRAKLARMAITIQAARQFSYAVARMMAKGEGTLEAAMVKAYVCKAAEWVTREAMQIHGGYGYAEEYAVSRYFVDACAVDLRGRGRVALPQGHRPPPGRAGIGVQVGEVAAAYAGCRQRIADLTAHLDQHRSALAVPTCPLWTVHDVVAHVTGVVDDALAGRLDGVATDPWTAAQVEARRAKPIATILEEWNEKAPEFEGLLDPIGDIGRQAVADIVTHEHDIRTALGEPGARNSDGVHVGLGFLAAAFVNTAASNNVAVRVCTSDGSSFGDRDAPVVLTADAFELLRAISGRRSVDQLRNMEWQGDGEAALPAFTFRTVQPGGSRHRRIIPIRSADELRGRQRSNSSTAFEPSPRVRRLHQLQQGRRPHRGAMKNDGSGNPDVWSVYLATDDAQATADAAVANGGQVYVPPMPVGDLGTMLLLADAGGAGDRRMAAGRAQGLRDPRRAGHPELVRAAHA